MDLEFSSQEELFKRVQPASNAKLAELHRLGYPYIQVSDIWRYLVEEKWKKSHELTLSDIVHDILHVDNKKIDEYLKGKKKDVICLEKLDRDECLKVFKKYEEMDGIIY